MSFTGKSLFTVTMSGEIAAREMGAHDFTGSKGMRPLYSVPLAACAAMTVRIV